MKRRGILFGLNYEKTPIRLNGCINDVKNMCSYLEKTWKIPCQIFTDENPSDKNTTSQGIIMKLYEMAILSYKENLDLVWIHYSGHGSYIQDKNGDEKDGKDECIVPSDYRTSGLISDDVIKSLFNFFNPKTKIIAIFDCCHSGTIADLKFSWENQKLQIENLWCNSPCKVILLSGCLDDQQSIEAYNIKEQKYCGVMTTMLINILSSKPHLCKDIFAIVDDLRNELRKFNFTQIPKLTSTYNLLKDRILI
jgi:hypothetical protein